LRVYRIGEDGREHTFRFVVESWWVTDVESYNREIPSLFNIEALSASSVLIWTKKKWTKLMEQIPALKQCQEILMANSYEASQRRIYSLISLSAEEKYNEFQKPIQRSLTASRCTWSHPILAYHVKPSAG
jgi:hypothetical protein